jgi:broad specificity phosphatase PhoE
MENDCSITIYLVRHGEAENNIRFILDSCPGKSEYPLTAVGRLQIAAVAETLKSADADVLLSSPLLRTRQTAEIIAEATGLEVFIDGRLCEAGMGIYEGKSAEELWQKYPTPESRLAPDPLDGVESYLDIRSRVTALLADIRSRFMGGKVIIVSHGDTLEQLHGILTNEAPGVSAAGWYPERGSCTEVIWKM